MSITLLITQALVCVCLYRSLLARWKLLRNRYCDRASRRWSTVARPQLSTADLQAGGLCSALAHPLCPAAGGPRGRLRAATVPNRLCESHCSDASREKGRIDGLLCKQLLVLSGCDRLQRWHNLIQSQIMPCKSRGTVLPEQIPMWSLVN